MTLYSPMWAVLYRKIGPSLIKSFIRPFPLKFKTYFYIFIIKTIYLFIPLSYPTKNTFCSFLTTHEKLSINQIKIIKIIDFSKNYQIDNLRKMIKLLTFQKVIKLILIFHKLIKNSLLSLIKY